MKTVAIIQARIGSTRLPGKVLADILGHPMLWRVVDRVRQAQKVDQVIVATTSATRDDALAEFCQAHQIECFRGDEQDVLDRYFQAARKSGATTIIRITADCPLIDPGVIDRVVGIYQQGGFDYVSNTIEVTYPDGLDTEVFSFASLEQAWQEATKTSEREHVTPYLRTSGKFQVRNVENDLGLPLFEHRWTVDEPADLEFV